MADTLISGTTIIEDKRSEKGEIWSCTGQSFRPTGDATTFDVNDKFDLINTTAATRKFTTVANIPQGARVTGVIVYGNDVTNTWTFTRIITSTGLSDTDLASGNVNTEDTTITNSTIDNSTYAYGIEITMAQNDRVNGARIKYGF